MRQRCTSATATEQAQTGQILRGTEHEQERGEARHNVMPCCRAHATKMERAHGRAESGERAIPATPLQSFPKLIVKFEDS